MSTSAAYIVDEKRANRANLRARAAESDGGGRYAQELAQVADAECPRQLIEARAIPAWRAVGCASVLGPPVHDALHLAD
jgi:hypothetical protein